MELLSTAAVAVSGLTACSEFASFAFVHPVVRRLPAEHHLTVEQGLLRTYGRAMPVLMPATGALTVAAARRSGRPAAWAAVAANVAALACTLSVNVPINKVTTTWDPFDPPADWKQTRDRWERFQAIRSPLLLAGFVLLCSAVTGSGARTLEVAPGSGAPPPGRSRPGPQVPRSGERSRVR